MVKKKEKKIKELFLSFNKKGDIFEYYKLSQNSHNTKIVNNILKELDIPSDYYNNKRHPKRYCEYCGKELEKKSKKSFVVRTVPLVITI